MPLGWLLRARRVERAPRRLANLRHVPTPDDLGSDRAHGTIRKPRLLSTPLSYELEGWHVARRGDYRVTCRIIEDGQVLLIGRIEHRAHVYRTR